MDGAQARGSAIAAAFNGLTKRFGQVVAVDDVSLEIREGSFHALLGENGAGKTTLMRLLAGELEPDAGTITTGGVARRFRSPRDARSHGVRLVHQHSVLIPNLTIAENFLLVDTDRSASGRRSDLSRSIRNEATRFGIDLDPNRPVWELSVTQRQWAEVFRALFGGGQILILDEPTAQLSPLEGDLLLAKLAALASRGMSVVLITHKLREVFQFADTVTVMRKGRRVTTAPVGQVSEESLAAMMVEDADQGDSQIDRRKLRRVLRQAEPLVELRDVVCVDHRGRTVLRSVNLQLLRGEVLGVAGVSGNGQAQLARVVAGVEHPTSGMAALTKVGAPSIRYIPDDRIHVATAATLSVLDNLSLRDFDQPPCASRGLLNLRSLENRAQARVGKFRIKAPSLRAPVSVLSGGNIQRVIIARELDGDPNVVVAHNPTAGLDIATASFVREQLLQVAERGGGVLLVSDDLDELLLIADRILVLHGAAVAGQVGRESFDPSLIARLMAGGSALPGELKA
jgi:ABC-type uncharacterized transport system ATPase subunit